jgi:hypothetical protein
MVLKFPPTGESTVLEILLISLSKIVELIAEDEMIRKMTRCFLITMVE